MGGTKQKKRKNNRSKRNKQKTDKAILKADPDIQNEEVDEENGVDSSNEDAVPQNKSRKREHNEDVDSDADEKPKRKKKKKPAPAEGGEKKGKKSIRQMKREKFAERQAEAEANAKDALKSQCLSYISQWKHDKQNWKFMKAKQVWLYKNKFSSTLVPPESWPLLLEYFESTQGNIRNMLLEDAQKIIKQMDEWTEKNGKTEEKEDELDDESESEKPDETSYKRARDLIQCLHE